MSGCRIGALCFCQGVGWYNHIMPAPRSTYDYGVPAKGNRLLGHASFKQCWQWWCWWWWWRWWWRWLGQWWWWFSRLPAQGIVCIALVLQRRLSWRMTSKRTSRYWSHTRCQHARRPSQAALLLHQMRDQWTSTRSCCQNILPHACIFGGFL